MTLEGRKSTGALGSDLQNKSNEKSLDSRQQHSEAVDVFFNCEAMTPIKSNPPSFQPETHETQEKLDSKPAELEASDVSIDCNGITPVNSDQPNLQPETLKTKKETMMSRIIDVYTKVQSPKNDPITPLPESVTNVVNQNHSDAPFKILDYNVQID